MEGGDEIGVEVPEVADDLAAGFEGIALWAALRLQAEEAVEAGAGEERGGQERALALSEDSGGRVAGAGRLACTAANWRPVSGFSPAHTSLPSRSLL